MNIKKCDQCGLIIKKAYTTPYGWRVAALYEAQTVTSGKGKKARKSRKRVFVDFRHLCPRCVRDGYCFGPDAKILQQGL